jgi:Ca2+-binding EF-hand superfamily protein
MPTFRVLAATALLVLTIPALAAAQPGSGRGPSWDQFAERHDLDGDGVVSADELCRSNPWFQRLDGDGDGLVTEQELEQVGAEMRAKAGSGIVRLADTDRDRLVTADEWQAFLETTDPDGDGTFSPEDLFANAPGKGRGRRFAGGRHRGEGPGMMLDKDGDGILEIEDLETLFAALDADGDGTLADEELPRFGPRHGRGFGRGPAGRGWHGPPGPYGS